MSLRALFLLALLVLPLAAAPPPQASAPASTAYSDGPYVLCEGTRAKVLRVREGRLEESLLAPPYRLQLEGLPPLALSPRTLAPARATFPLPTRIAAVSDIHGNLASLRTLLQAQKIMDGAGRWTFGRGHLVVVGDVLDRGPQVTEILWLLRSLETQALGAGGHLHMVLGNHEAMGLRGDVRYLNPKYEALRKGILPVDYPVLMGPDGEFGRWLRARPVLLRLGDVLFVHGGPSPDLLQKGLDLGKVNAQFRLDLADPGKPYLLGTDGPVWYRGLIPGADPKRPDASEAEVEALLRACGARTLVVGHTTQERITPFHGGRVVGIDAGLKDGKPGELWIREGKTSWRGLADGTRVLLP
jgi:hypothetical protein